MAVVEKCISRNIFTRLRRLRFVHSMTYSTQTSTSKSGGEKSSTVNDAEIGRFDQLSGSWWSESGEFRALHSMNALRVPLIRDGLRRRVDQKNSSPSKPLCGLDILDVGCGGGILTEPLCRLGARVTGLDASSAAIHVARQHAAVAGLHPPAFSLQYVCGSLGGAGGTVDGSEGDSERGSVDGTEDSKKSGTVDGSEGGSAQLERRTFDGVVASEVLEHVDRLDEFVHLCVQHVKPRGSFFVTTINKTCISQILGIKVAEDILRIVPPGTHDWEKFVPPQHLRDLLAKEGLRIALQHGITYNPLTNRWHWIKDTSVNYAIHAIKDS